MYRCKRFSIEELVPPSILELVPEEVAWRMFDEDLLKVIDQLANKFSPNKPVTINNWKWGGDFTQSGLRTPESEYYNPNSTHPYGCAVDMKFEKDVDEIREYIRNHQEDFPLITEIEEDVSWLHVSTSDRYKHLMPEGGIVFYGP